MRKVGFFLLALVAAAALGSVIQSVVNLLAIQQLTSAVSIKDGIAMIGFDLRHFMPMLAAIFLPLILISLLFTKLLSRLLLKNHIVIAALLTAVVAWIALAVINHLAPMPTLIALNRSVGGTFALVSCAAMASALYCFLSRGRTTE